ncbi:MAG: hypothetical protein R3E95_14965 [Thiolinea sp.]
MKKKILALGGALLLAGAGSAQAGYYCNQAYYSSHARSYNTYQSYNYPRHGYYQTVRVWHREPRFIW